MTKITLIRLVRNPDRIAQLKCVTHMRYDTEPLDFDGYIHPLDEEIRYISTLTNLVWLEICNTGLEFLPATFANLTNLVDLDLSGCRFDHVPDVVSNMPNLRNLMMTNNPIDTAPLFVCETGLQVFCANKTFLMFDEHWDIVRSRNEKVYLSTLRRYYHEFHWRREVCELLPFFLPQPIAEELHDSLTHCIDDGDCEHRETYASKYKLPEP